jgi:hypothetical protein
LLLGQPPSSDGRSTISEAAFAALGAVHGTRAAGRPEVIHGAAMTVVPDSVTDPVGY